ncbi:MAG: hypothetical protein R3Y57_01385 [Erysipelotrichaceae bacterium]
MKKWNLEKIIYGFVMFTMILSSVLLVIIMIKAPVMSTDPTVRVKADFTLMLTQSLLGIVVLILPSILAKKWMIEIPSHMMILYVIFLYCAIFLGEVRSFYYNVPHWDTILHGFSGAMLGALGFSFVSLLNKSEGIPLELSPAFVAFFAFCFAVTLGVAWEVYEFTFDGVLGLNMQKFMLEDGTLLLGRAALQDTMKDLIVDAVGAAITSLMGYLSLKYQTQFIHNIQLRKAKRGNKDETV